MDPCDVNADCVREGLLSSNFTCTCIEPYSDGDGFKCSSKITGLYKPIANKATVSFIVPDPCLMDPCDVNADCVREGLLCPNFTCTCISPFIDGDGFYCSSRTVQS